MVKAKRYGLSCASLLIAAGAIWIITPSIVQARTGCQPGEDCVQSDGVEPDGPSGPGNTMPADGGAPSTPDGQDYDPDLLKMRAMTIRS